ncbi:hypothetical protein PC120_g14078 [Phytophthora cactorum]|nr:hypothetical protein PC120_g14078 [Phytophthora cactorum]
MRLHGVVLLGVTALLARINASSDAEAATTSFAVAEHGVSTARSLRIGYITKEDDEERMVNVKSLVGADTISRSVSFDTLRAAKSDTVLSQLLIAWKKIPDMEKVATSWQNMQLQTWLESGVSPQKVFKYLMLDDEAGNLFTSPQFKTWLDYSMDFKKANPRADTATVIDTLAAHYSDTALARIIKTAKADPTTKIRGAFFENALLGKWVKDGKSSTYISNMLGRQVTPDDAFKLLSLDKAPDNLFASREYSSWLTYANVFKEENPGAPSKPLIDTLMAHYSDQKLTRIIKAAQTNRLSKLRAAQFEKELFAKWVENGKTSTYISNTLGRQVTPDDAFNLLSLDRAADNIFTHSAYDTWLKYAKSFKEENPNVKTDPVIDTLMTNLGDHAVFELIKRAEKTPATEEKAAYIKNALLDEWVKTNKAPASVVNLLGTSSDDRNVLLSTYLEKIKSTPVFTAAD